MGFNVEWIHEKLGEIIVAVTVSPTLQGQGIEKSNPFLCLLECYD